MADTEITKSHKLEAENGNEMTKPGPVFSPAVDIFETEEALKVVADVPGAAADTVGIDLEDDILTVTAEVEPVSDKETLLMAEYETGRYFRRFRLGQVIDKNMIEARLDNGVLQLILPKIEPAKPRKIEVKVG